MVSNSNGGVADFKGDYAVNVTGNGLKDFNSHAAALDISTSRKALLRSGSSSGGIEKQNKSKIYPSRLSILRLSSDGSIPSPTAKFRKIAEDRDEISRSVPSSSSQGFRERFSGIIAQKLDWEYLWKTGRNWIENPFNMALFLWITCVAVSGAILFLVMTGMLNHALPKKSQRDVWFEVNNQILNALFTLMCLYQHPKRFHHLVLLCRWSPKDISKLRNIYCKNGTYKPHEWAHMMVVVVLLHLNCFAQYALCGLNLGYRRPERPVVGVAICLSVAIAAPALAGIYSIVSPLGKDYNSELDEEAQDTITPLSNDINHLRRTSLEKRFSFALRNDERIIEHAPFWKGGLFDIWDNIAIAYLSHFCSFCVFGWNMERLGFGNMYVHIATFLLLCIAPFWIFNLAAINIDNETVRQALGLTGIVLCLFGLLYGGFWRIQMRKRFKLPENNACCGKPAIGDCCQWLFCCWCSLAQEVRTADFYNIMENKFCQKQTAESNWPSISPLPHDAVQFIYNQTSPLQSSISLPILSADNFMEPPVLSSIQREEAVTKPAPKLR